MIAVIINILAAIVIIAVVCLGSLEEFPTEEQSGKVVIVAILFISIILGIDLIILMIVRKKKNIKIA